MTQTSYRKTLRMAAIYDLIVTGALIVPPLVPLAFGLIAGLDAALGFGTGFAPLDPTSVFFVNLAAAGIIAWALIRLKAPSFEALQIDIFYRLSLIMCQLWAVWQGATPILLGISVVLAIIVMVELNVMRTGRRIRLRGTS